MLAYGVFADPATVAKHIQLLSDNLPSAAAEIIGDQLRNVSAGASGAKGLGLIASLAVALFGARNAARSLVTGLNIAFGANEMRGFLGGNLVALAITAGGIVSLVVAGGASAALALISGPIGTLASFCFLAGSAILAAAALYRFAPNEVATPWHAAFSGGLIFAVGWIAATAGFAFYAANFGSYNATYGSLGAVVVLITWFYVSALMLLLGGEVASLKSHALTE